MSRRLYVTLVGIMLLTAVFSVVTEYVNGWPASFLPDKNAVAVVSTLVLVAYLGAGLVAWQRHPGERTGLLFSVVGWCWFVPMAGALHAALPYTIGQLTLSVWVASLAHLGLAWPFGRLRSRLEVGLVAGSYALGLLGNLAVLLFLDPKRGCTACVSNLLLVHASQTTINRLNPYLEVIFAVLSVAVLAVAAQHWLSARGYLRRQMNVFALVALPAIAYVVLLKLWDSHVGGLSYAVAQVCGPLLLLSPPLGYTVRVLRARRAERSVGTAVVDVTPTGTPERLREALARALGDPSLQLAFRSPSGAGFLAPDGAPVDLAKLPAGRVAVAIDGRGDAVLVHDEQLSHEPDLVRVVVAAANLAIEHTRLRAEVEAQLEDVRASRARIVEAADAARRRIERDLHDGAQQRLVTLALALSMAEQRAGSLDTDLASLLESASMEAKEALFELRELARGIHPAVLTQTGLPGALQALVERSAAHATLKEVVQYRLPEAVEATAYFVVSESLTNAAKHAPGASVGIAVRAVEGGIAVEVADDGPGGARLEDGTGLTGLADRVSSVGGSFAVSSRPAQGTRVSAFLPCTTRLEDEQPLRRRSTGQAAHIDM